MALIELTGKYAVGGNRYAKVDEDMVAYLSQWRWKAKPNGNGSNVYAVRNAKRGGKCVTIRMHREVLGMDEGDARDVDHLNHDSLDNRAANLRATTRSQNILNARRVAIEGACRDCGLRLKRVVSACAAHNQMVCDDCKKEAAKAYSMEWRRNRKRLTVSTGNINGSSAEGRDPRALRASGFA